MANEFQSSAPGIATNTYSGAIAGTVTDVTTNTDNLICSLHLRNNNAAVASLQVFDLPAASVTLGTTAPTLSFGMAVSGTDLITFDFPVRFTTGFSIAATTTRTGNTAGSIDVNIAFVSR